MGLTEAQRAALAAPLPRDMVKKLPGGAGADYVSGHYIVARLNEVFGHDGWSDEYGDMTVREGARPLVSVPCTLTAGGCVRRNIGVGLAANDKPDAIETAIKAAYTDALKRCAYKLGDSFGLALYEKAEGGRRSGVGLSTMALAMLEEIEGLPSRAAINAWLTDNTPHVARLQDDEKDVIRGAVSRQRLDLSDAAPPQSPQAPAERPSQPPSGEHMAAPSQAPAAPSEALSAALTRLSVARSGQSIVAVLRGAAVPDAERGALWTAGLAAAGRIGEDESALRARVTNAAALNASAAQWATVATVLIAVEISSTPSALDAVRKQYAAAVTALPPALLAGVKAATTERARSIGAPTMATKIAAQVAAARRPDDLTAVYQSLQLAAANGQLSQREVDELTAEMNARGDAMRAA